MHAGIAAGHPATAAAGAEMLANGGNAADAAVAATLASCVAETLMTGLLGGGHAIYWDAASATAANLDCFCASPSGEGGGLVELQVPFGEELVHYAIGPASYAVPGVPAGVGALHARFGRLPWRDVFEPALRLARRGAELTPAHESCLAMLAPERAAPGRRARAAAGDREGARAARGRGRGVLLHRLAGAVHPVADARP